MKSTFAKQVIIGLFGLLLSIGFFVLSLSIFNITNKWFIDIILIITTGCFFGSLMHIFGGKYMFLYGVKLGITFVVFIIMIKELPGIFSGIFITICAVLVLAVPVVREYLFDREKNSASPINKRLARKIKEQEELEQKINDENNELLSSISFGEKSLLLRTSGGSFYQCIKGDGKLYFIYVGGELSGVNFDLIRTDFSNENTFISKKKDYLINNSDINSIKYKTQKIQNSVFINSGSIVIKCNSFKKRFLLLETISIESIKTFFDGIKLDIKLKNKNVDMEDSIIENVNADRHKLLIARLKLICAMLTVVSVGVSAAFLFLIINYRLMSVLSMALFISIFILYVKYNDIFSIADEKNQKTFTKGKINISILILIPCFGLGIRSLLDFNITSYKMLMVWVLLIFLTFIFIFFRFTHEYKRKKSSIWVIIIAILFFAPAAAVQTNYLFDSSKSIVVQSKIDNMRVSKGSKSPDRYLIKVTISNGKGIELGISKEYYNRLSNGDTVEIVEKEGFLKIPYAFVNED
ncbi:MAG: hypothetical protein Q8942_00355 [Bacillota bacterium]|nr:hypothetical protein [Bacillota bacterium]